MNNATTWNVTGAIAAQSGAHSRLMLAIASGTAVEIWLGDCRVTTCASVAAAQLYVGKSKKYRIVQQGRA